MGFKADTSFLRFLSMGAAGTRQTMTQMRAAGFVPIELERYCTSNKIWATKVKRLRLPDLLCVRTGLRVEVRAKSDLKIRMSDAPNNPDRQWDTGLRDDDLTALIACFEDDGSPSPADEAVFFTVGDLRSSVATSALGPAKSASEGAERDRTWPATVPKKNGEVQYVNADLIRVLMDGEDGGRPRTQTFALRDRRGYVKTAYVQAGDRFVGGASILAGTPPRLASLSIYRHHVYDPLAHLDAENAVDRYAAVKSLPFRPDLRQVAVPAIEERLDVEAEDRVLLEAAGAGAALGSTKAVERLVAMLWSQERADLRMEAVLILTELRAAGACEILKRVAVDRRFDGDEIRQAAVWGLGKAGLRQYEDLLPFISDPDRDVALHAIVGFAADAGPAVIDCLITDLLAEDDTHAPAASEALRRIGNDLVLERLIVAKRGRNRPDPWLLATLGRMPPDRVRAALAGDPILDQLAPLLLLSDRTNWIAEDAVDIDLKFLIKQNL